MRVVNGIAYADTDADLVPRIVGVRAMPEHQLWVRFETGEERTIDVSPLLESGVFARLKDESVFAGVALDYGVPTWPDVAVDLAPELVYQESSLAA